MSDHDQIRVSPVGPETFDVYPKIREIRIQVEVSVNKMSLTAVVALQMMNDVIMD